MEIQDVYPLSLGLELVVEIWEGGARRLQQVIVMERRFRHMRNNMQSLLPLLSHTPGASETARAVLRARNYCFRTAEPGLEDLVPGKELAGAGGVVHPLRVIAPRGVADAGAHQLQAIKLGEQAGAGGVVHPLRVIAPDEVGNPLVSRRKIGASRGDQPESGKTTSRLAPKLFSFLAR